MQDLQLSQHQQRGDFTFLSHSHDFQSILDHMKQDNDEVQKLTEKIREFEQKNKELTDYITLIAAYPEQIKDNPQAEILRKKIEVMEKENKKLREFIRTAEQPQPVNYTDREKVVSGMATPRNYKKELFHDELERESLRSIPRNKRRVLEEIDNNYEKVFTEVSTCQNYPIYRTGTKQQPEQVKIRRMAELTDTEKKIKNGLKLTAEVEMRKKEVVRREINVQDHRSEVKPKNIKNLKALEQYKNKLVNELKKSNLRQSQLKKILCQLMKVHKNSIDKFNQLAKMLEELKQTGGQDNINDQVEIVQKYQQALRLQQILVEIQSRNEEQRKQKEKENEEELIHLKSIRRELFKIIQKLGLKIDVNNMTLEESIQALCNQIIFNVYLPSIRSVSSTNAKLQRIRELTELEKVNNSKIIAQLKNKQQALSKQLMNLQIGSKHQIE